MRVFSIIRKSRSFQGFRFEFNSIRYEHEIINAFPLSFSLFHADTHTYTQLGAESCSLMRIRTQGLHCFVYGWEDRVMRVAEVHRIVGSHLHTRQLCFLQLFLRHTLRGTLRELGGAGACTRFVGWKEGALGTGRGGGTARGEDSSRVFLVSIHNCKFPSAYLCSFRPTFLSTCTSTYAANNAVGSNFRQGKCRWSQCPPWEMRHRSAGLEVDVEGGGRCRLCEEVDGESYVNGLSIF